MKVYKTIDGIGTQHSIVGDGVLFYLYHLFPSEYSCTCRDGKHQWNRSGVPWSCFAKTYGGEEVSPLEFVVRFGETPEQVWNRTK
jgi:hypothetical protein